MVSKFSPGDLIIDNRLANPDLEVVLFCDEKFVYFYDLNDEPYDLDTPHYFGELNHYCLAPRYEQLSLFDFSELDTSGSFGCNQGPGYGLY